MSAPGPWPNQPAPVGFYPLAPLTLGDILGSAIKIAWRHLVLLAPLALIVGGVAAIIELATLSSSDAGQRFLDGSWGALAADASPAEIEQALADLFPVMWAVGVAALVSGVLSPVVSGIAAPLVAQAATTRTGTDAGAFHRLTGRWIGLIGASVLMILAVAAGTLLLVVPGVIVGVGLAVIGPVAAMEGATPTEALRRSWKLTLGFKWRVFGIELLCGLFVAIAAMIVTALVELISGPMTYTSSLVVSVIVGAFTGAWMACVTALIYVDLRIRKEGLADSLRRAVS